MADTTNTNMEKLYFTHILSNPEQFSKVDPSFFMNSDIQFIYTVVREEVLRGKNHIVPSNTQILTMVKLEDKEKKISEKVVSLLLNSENSEISDDWLIPRFKAWKIKNQIKDELNGTIDIVRGITDVNYDNTVEAAIKIKTAFGNILTVDDDDFNFGLDFNNPEHHKQHTSKVCIPTGWSVMDGILKGGWSKSTFNVIMGETNVGKSMWLHNIAVNAANAGINVIIITLEMSEPKVMKRVGSMRLKIPVDDYDERSKDTTFMKLRINNVKSQSTVGNLFDTQQGNIWIKKYPTSDCTITDVDNFIKKFEDTLKVKVGMVLVDYINIMSIEKGYEFVNMLYLKGKHLAEGLRRIADKYELCMITATQTDKSVWGASDIKLADIPESKAIADTADSVWGIIRNPEMKRNNIYRLKILKLRDGEHKEEQVRFDFNTKFLTMENDVLVGVK